MYVQRYVSENVDGITAGRSQGVESQQKPSEVAMKRNEVESNPRTGSDFDHLMDQGGRWHDLQCVLGL